MADQRLMALQQMMGGMGGSAPEAPAAEPMAAPAPEGGDEASAIEQAMALLTPFASNPAIEEALMALSQSQGGPPPASGEDTMPEGVESL